MASRLKVGDRFVFVAEVDGRAGIQLLLTMFLWAVRLIHDALLAT